MSTSTTIQSTAERIGAALLRARHLRAREMIMRGHDFPAAERLRPGDRCGPDGRFVVVDAGDRERLAEFREMVSHPTASDTEATKRLFDALERSRERAMREARIRAHGHETELKTND